MVTRYYFTLAFLLLMTTGQLFAIETQPAENVLYRSALIVGSNTGAANREQLRYAVKDAQSFAEVIQNLGGVTKTSCILLENPDALQLKKAIDQLSNTTEKSSTTRIRKEVLFYYSGHADERGFLLGNEVFDYSTLKAKLNSIEADVRIAIVDACASGNLTREKGGIARPPFLFDASTQMKGHAYLTSSSQNESAMESDRIKGSFFTNSLVSALRGGADFNTDGKITLNEAYQFTFNETLKKTEKTITGPQHAGYDIRLKGSGDLVMTDLRAGNSGIAITESLTGNFYIRDDAGTLVVEVNKQHLKPMMIGLEAGSYEITLERDNNVFTASLDLNDNSYTTISENNFTKVNRSESRSRGNSIFKQDTVSYHNIPVVVSFFPSLRTSGISSKTNTEFLLGILGGGSDKVSGAAISSIVNIIQDQSIGLEISGIANLIRGPSRGADITGIVNLIEDGKGVQISGISNISKNYTGSQISGINNISKGITGIQISGLSNNANGILNGGQISSIANFSKSCKGTQIGGIANFCGNTFKGLQITGIGNLIKDSSDAVQIGGVFNYSKSNSGIQISGISNLTGGMQTTVQISGGANISTDTFIGAQIGTINYTGYAKGVQLGVCNIQKSGTGLQIGVFNYSQDSEGTLIGLISLVKKYPPHAQLWVDELGFLNAAIRTGNKHSFSFLGLCAKKENRDVLLAPVCGFGFRKTLTPSFIGIDFICKTLMRAPDWNDGVANMSSVRLTSGYRFKNHFTLWGGPTFNTYSHDRHFHLDVPSWSFHRKDFNMWPGFVIGADF
ncbi:MAG TPA: caspase family protein [Chitinispirillaceae bacterium]|nr:caspase family protein [Chitinispirillaceae bacterium]